MNFKNEKNILLNLSEQIREEEDLKAINAINKAIKDLNLDKESNMSQDDEQIEDKEKFMVTLSFDSENHKEAEYLVTSLLNWINAAPSVTSYFKLEKLVSLETALNAIREAQKKEEATKYRNILVPNPNYYSTLQKEESSKIFSPNGEINICEDSSYLDDLEDKFNQEFEAVDSQKELEDALTNKCPNLKLNYGKGIIEIGSEVFHCDEKARVLSLFQNVNSGGMETYYANLVLENGNHETTNVENLVSVDFSQKNKGK